MEGISDIKIIGLDESRLPRILKEPYINLYFKLIHQAPKRWCDLFNDLVANGSYTVKIDPLKGEFIETWVRKPDEIVDVLQELKLAIKTCIQTYIERVRAETEANAALGASEQSGEEGEQGRLNRIIKGLDFSDT